MALAFVSVFPKSLTKFVLFRFYSIRLEIEEEKNGDEVSICRYKYGARGALCISIDFEKPIHRRSERAKISREAISGLLQLSERYEIPISWGVCGNIVIGESDYRKSFEQIVASKVKRDLGSHTFSHVDLSTCSYKDAKAEIIKDIGILTKIRRPTTFIFPYNKQGHLDLLRELGFTAYRGTEEKLAYPSRLYGLWNVHSTYFFGERSSDIAAYGLLFLLLRLLDLAIAHGCVLHIWSHPWSMSIDRSARRFAEKVLRPLFSHAARERDRRLLWICTVRELANYLEARENCIIEKYVKRDNKIRVDVRCSIDDSRFDFPPEVTIKLQLTTDSISPKVFVNEKEVLPGKSCYVVKKRDSFLFLTLSFERPVKSITILMGKYPSY